MNQWPGGERLFSIRNVCLSDKLLQLRSMWHFPLLRPIHVCVKVNCRNHPLASFLLLVWLTSIQQWFLTHHCLHSFIYWHRGNWSLQEKTKASDWLEKQKFNVLGWELGQRAWKLYTIWCTLCNDLSKPIMSFLNKWNCPYW